MRIALFLASGLVLTGLLSLARADSPATQPTSVLDFTNVDIHGKDVPMSNYKGKVLLIVNVASKCGHTPQYAALEQHNEKYGPQGLAVLGFPCNDFHQQEPGTDAQILEFCQATYHVKFDMFSKVTVKGDKKTPMFEYLISKTTDPKFGGEIAWNFNKFLIDRDGHVVGRFEPAVKPDDAKVVKAIEDQLAKK